MTAGTTASETASLNPFFIDGPEVSLFCVHYPHHGGRCRARVVVVPPFAEELNKCRLMVSRTASVLAGCGLDVLVVDASGTGDSAGEFRDGTPESWAGDISVASRWLATREPGAAPVLLAIRAGALLVPDIVSRVDDAAPHVVLWQPVLNGRQYIRQFLRLRVVSNKFLGLEETVDELFGRLENGETIEVAGYEITPRLAAALSGIESLALERGSVARVDVLEFRPAAGDALSKVNADLVASLRSAGIDAAGRRVAAEQFWTTQELSAPPEVSDATRALLTAPET